MDGCIETQAKGYSKRWIDGRPISAHRAAWIEANGPIPDGLQINHRCGNSRCVNPEHLYAGTQQQNMLDRIASGWRPKRKEACLHGHAYTEENTYINTKGAQVCRTCKRQRDAIYNQTRSQR